MLVLSRKQNQQIQIGEDVVITVVRVAGDQVRIGIQAPRDVSVMRTELLEQQALTQPARRVLHHAAPDTRCTTAASP